MERDLLGTRRFAVVRDDFEQHQVGGWVGGVIWWCGVVRCGGVMMGAGFNHVERGLLLCCCWETMTNK